jgi:hypothetical protein
VERPLVLSVSTPRAHTPSSRAVVTQTRRGRGLMKAPTRDQMPVLVGSAEPKVGRLGQNIQRPKITSRAGSRVIIESRVTPTPMAHTGPRPAVEFMSARVRQSMPTMTVPPLAMIAGVARCSAKAIASWRSS